MKSVKYELNGKTYYLNFNGAAMYAVEDIGVKDVVEVITGAGKENFEKLCRVAEILIEQGELVRRYFGHDNGDTVTAEELMIVMSPGDVIKLRVAVMDAVVSGYGRETGQDDEIDLGLLEIEKKKVNE